MKKRIIYSFLLLSLISINAKSQILKDSLYGNVKRLSEKVIFLTKKENPQLMYNADYGHSGFMGPKSTISKFRDSWYTSPWCYYLNYVRDFDKKRRVVKDVWFGKKNDLRKSYRYLYDKEERLISVVDSTNYSKGTENHYYTDYGEENIIKEYLSYNLFSHTYKKYKDGKIIFLKKYNEHGVVDECGYYYSENGKLEYSVRKNSNNWRHEDEKNFSYGLADSTARTYKNLINVYDNKNRLIKRQMFSLEDEEKSQNPVLTNEKIYKYKNDSIVATIEYFQGGGSLSYLHLKRDKFDRIVERYCCGKEISQATIVEKYRYKDNKISILDYAEESLNDKGKMDKYHVVFTYKFDNQNNWIEIIKKVNGVDLYKWIREIEYY